MPAGFHPGHTNLNSRILHEGPLKLTIYSETEDKNWICTWEVYPGYATMTLFQVGTGLMVLACLCKLETMQNR